MAGHFALTSLALLPLIAAQQIGKVPEVHPKLPTQQCSKRHGCTTLQTSVVIDALTHPIQNVHTGASCENSTGQPDPTVCPTGSACAKSCALEGINYAQHGVQTHGNAMTLHQYLEVNGTETTVSPRLYLLDPSGKNYESLKLLNQEFTFTVDVSNLPCGMNGALYMSAMSPSGGRSALNPAGAAYGTGYCDAQCPKLPWINGVANVNNHGACCNEMDIWEANAVATQFTPHACNISGLVECTGDQCGFNGLCDEYGCGINPYAQGDHLYYGYHDVVDTTQPFTVVTQFHTDDGTSHGTLNSISRLYLQHGKVLKNANITFDGKPLTAITNAYCNATAPWFQQRGGLAQMGKAIGEGMVLAMSIWNDQGGNMTWLDSGNAGPCTADEGAPSVILANDPTTSVTFSAIKWGDIGSTYSTGIAGYHG